jgi:hypothetical protein
MVFFIRFFIVYKSTSDFYVLILYTFTLLNMFMIFKNILVEVLESFRYKNIPLANRDYLTFSSLFESLLFLSPALLLWLRIPVLHCIRVEEWITLLSS